MMQFDKKLINVKAGQKVTIDFENPDGMQHNFLLIKPKSLKKFVHNSGKKTDETSFLSQLNI